MKKREAFCTLRRESNGGSIRVPARRADAEPGVQACADQAQDRNRFSPEPPFSILKTDGSPHLKTQLNDRPKCGHQKSQRNVIGGIGETRGGTRGRAPEAVSIESLVV